MAAFGERPDLVAAVVVPLRGGVRLKRRQILPFVFFVHKQIFVWPKRNLYETPAKFWDNCQSDLLVSNLLRTPSFVVHWTNTAPLRMRDPWQGTKQCRREQ